MSDEALDQRRHGAGADGGVEKSIAIGAMGGGGKGEVIGDGGEHHAWCGNETAFRLIL
jgi:hypothetical protein